ncbi:MAG: rhodanese-like domain-containing protein [Bradymonadales bacterium]|nr:MAG: rhodanese-like domain-containing protein [Bradymonadales bacterium]
MDLKEKLLEVELIDVRQPDELTGELGHIPGARRVTLQTELEKFLPSQDAEKTFVFICRSGGRSSRATEMALSAGLKHSFNLMGGMIRWNALDLPVSKETK